MKKWRRKRRESGGGKCSEKLKDETGGEREKRKRKRSNKIEEKLSLGF